MLTAKFTFYLLSGAAFPLLLGGLVVNGTMGAMYKAWSTGKFGDGTPCYSVYSGLPLIDWMEAIQVTFWQPIVKEGETLLQARMLCASLQTAGLWAAIENSRRGEKHWVLKFAPIYAFFWGACGVATLLPIYCWAELTQRSSTIASARLPLSKAKALLPALAIGLIYPYYLMLFTPNGSTTAQHQGFITFYQFSPFFVYAVIQTFSAFLSSKPATLEEDEDAYYVRLAYAISGLWSAVAYVSIALLSLKSSDPSLSFSRIFVPSFNAVSTATEATHIKEGSFLFMQIDYIIVAAACVLYAVKTLDFMWLGGPEGAKRLSSNGGTVVAASLVATVGCLLVGPGAMMSAVLYAREGMLRKWAKGQSGNGSIEKN